jgi:signal transduction histidine kinase
MSAVGGAVLAMPARTGDAICNLAHDLRQPLSAIEAIAYYLEMTLPIEQLEARKHLLRLQELVETSSTILSHAVNATLSGN